MENSNNNKNNLMAIKRLIVVTCYNIVIEIL